MAVKQQVCELSFFLACHDGELSLDVTFAQSRQINSQISSVKRISFPIVTWENFVNLVSESCDLKI